MVLDYIQIYQLERQSLNWLNIFVTFVIKSDAMLYKHTDDITFGRFVLLLIALRFSIQYSQRNTSYCSNRDTKGGDKTVQPLQLSFIGNQKITCQGYTFCEMNFCHQIDYPDL